ncbi:MAG: hypothetical protein P8P49_05620 [Opitutales bacterium]|nr:hypothetical protein [Opitutales bacterium]
MRNLLKTHILEMPVGIPEALPALHRGVHPGEIISPPAGIKPVEHTTSFSQRSRRSVMIDNARKASCFMEEQQRVVKELIKELQIFTGYIEQLPMAGGLVNKTNSWSVYLMHAQSLHSAMKGVFQEKALFGDGASPPIRVHLEQDGVVTPFDLPDPSLVTMISIRSFIAGVADHKLPSVDLSNACMAELLNTLVEIQQGRERLSTIVTNLRKKASLGIPQSRKSAKIQTCSDKPYSLVQRFLFGFQSFFRLTTPIQRPG